MSFDKHSHISQIFSYCVYLERSVHRPFTLDFLFNNLPILIFPDVWTSNQNVSHCLLFSEDLYFWSLLNPDKENSPMYWLKFCPLKRFAFIPVLIGTVVLQPSALLRHFHNVRTIYVRSKGFLPQLSHHREFLVKPSVWNEKGAVVRIGIVEISAPWLFSWFKIELPFGLSQDWFLINRLMNTSPHAQ